MSNSIVGASTAIISLIILLKKFSLKEAIWHPPEDVFAYVKRQRRVDPKYRIDDLGQRRV